MEQTCSQLFTSTRIRFDDEELQAIQDVCDVDNICIKRGCARACNGHRDAKDKVGAYRTFIAPDVSLTRGFARMYLFTLQLIQIPLITIGRIPAIRQHKILGNIVFWVSLYSGFPLLCVAYMVY